MLFLPTIELKWLPEKRSKSKKNKKIDWFEKSVSPVDNEFMDKIMTVRDEYFNKIN